MPAIVARSVIDSRNSDPPVKIWQIQPCTYVLNLRVLDHAVTCILHYKAPEYAISRRKELRNFLDGAQPPCLIPPPKAPQICPWVHPHPTAKMLDICLCAWQRYRDVHIVCCGMYVYMRNAVMRPLCSMLYVMINVYTLSVGRRQRAACCIQPVYTLWYKKTVPSPFFDCNPMNSWSISTVSALPQLEMNAENKARIFLLTAFC